ncbi:family S53 protease [Dentipellis sp. KUC8613]|nr:family S53 protease [Dentipellis sp. KUC8613]
MRRSSVVACAAFLVAAAPSNMRVHDRREDVPSGFVPDGSAPADQLLHLRISLVQSNPAGLEDALYAASTPCSGQYGQNLSKDQVNAFVAPSPDTVLAVNAWLSSHNLTSTTISPAGDWLRVQTTVEQANSLLDAKYTTFTHQNTGKKTIRTLSYSIPASLNDHVNLVYPTTMFPVEARRSPVASTFARRSVVSSLTQRDIPISCNLTVTPACIQDTYGLPAMLATQPGNRIGVAGFDNEYVDEADLKLFLQMYRPDLNASTTFEFQSVNGGQNPQNQSLAGSEAVLDIQWTVGLALGVPVTFYSVGETNGVGGIEDWIDLATTLLSEDTPPQVFTTSYSWNEPNVTESVSRSLCNMYAQLGARGTTVIFSSGDGGVDGGSIGGAPCDGFVPTFPSNCPFVTSVGATVFSPPEEAAPYSSGGFSNIFSRPPYQDAAVSNFLTQLGDTYKGEYNASGRGFPDISAQGADMVSVYRGRVTGLGGTSYSAPIIASTIALLNNELLAAGKGTLGFLNPLLYANPDAFRDIERGNNPGCGTNGFTAVEGWDPVSGVGTPLYPALRKAVGL